MLKQSLRLKYSIEILYMKHIFNYNPNLFFGVKMLHFISEENTEVQAMKTEIIKSLKSK